MKKISFLLLSALTLLFAACSESTFEMHQTNFWPQRPDGMKFYADQVYDTTQVYSLDPWTAEIDAKEPWFTISPTSGDARPGTSALTKMDIKMPQNNTGKNRAGRIVVHTYENNTVVMPVYQSSWLNIMYPAPVYEGDTYENRTASFELLVTAKDVKSEITFHTYQDNGKLTSDSEWVTPKETTFKKGHHAVELAIEPNTSKVERKAMLLLTSGDVTTAIFVKQAGKKEDKKD